jgi:hypothetical protein
MSSLTGWEPVVSDEASLGKSARNVLRGAKPRWPPNGLVLIVVRTPAAGGRTPSPLPQAVLGSARSQAVQARTTKSTDFSGGSSRLAVGPSCFCRDQQSITTTLDRYGHLMPAVTQPWCCQIR